MTRLASADPCVSLSFGETSSFARGLVQFDSSGNRPIRQRCVRAAHPDPLPRDREQRASPSGMPRVLDCSARGAGSHPLPEGEGRGNRPRHGAAVVPIGSAGVGRFTRFASPNRDIALVDRPMPFVILAFHVPPLPGLDFVFLDLGMVAAGAACGRQGATFCGHGLGWHAARFHLR